jgi:hypothetical protein
VPETFAPFTWIDGAGGGTPITAAQLNRLEVGLESMDDRAAALEIGVGAPVSVTYAASVTLNASQGPLFRVVATGNLTLATITNGTDGQLISLEVRALGGDRVLTVGGEAVTVPAGSRWWGDFRYDSSTDEWTLRVAGGGGGGGAVGSVNGQAGVVVLDADDLADGTTKVMMTAAERTLVTLHTSQLDALDGVSNIGNSGLARALTPGGGNGTVKLITLDNNCVFTFNNPSTSGRAFTLELVLTQDGSGSRVPTWPGTVRWAGGVAPTLSTTAGAVDRLVFVTYNQGTTWYGDLVGKAYA